jgi:hypothetical protein
MHRLAADNIRGRPARRVGAGSTSVPRRAPSRSSSGVVPWGRPPLSPNQPNTFTVTLSTPESRGEHVTVTRTLSRVVDRVEAYICNNTIERTQRPLLPSHQRTCREDLGKFLCHLSQDSWQMSRRDMTPQVPDPWQMSRCDMTFGSTGANFRSARCARGLKACFRATCRKNSQNVSQIECIDITTAAIAQIFFAHES